MFRAVSTEVEGWKEALSDADTVMTIVYRLVLIALSSAASMIGVMEGLEPGVVLLGLVGASLFLSLLVLRVRGRA